MTRSDLLSLARAGAQTRLNEIEVERQRLLRYFPGLAGAVSFASSPTRRLRRSAPGRQSGAEEAVGGMAETEGCPGAEVRGGNRLFRRE